MRGAPVLAATRYNWSVSARSLQDRMIAEAMAREAPAGHLRGQHEWVYMAGTIQPCRICREPWRRPTLSAAELAYVDAELASYEAERDQQRTHLVDDDYDYADRYEGRSRDRVDPAE